MIGESLITQPSAKPPTQPYDCKAKDKEMFKINSIISIIISSKIS